MIMKWWKNGKSVMKILKDVTCNLNLISFNPNSIEFIFIWIQIELELNSNPIKKKSNANCYKKVLEFAYHLWLWCWKKTTMQNKKLKKHLSIPLKVDSKLEFIWVGQKFFTSKLHSYTNFNASIITSEILRNMKALMG